MFRFSHKRAAALGSAFLVLMSTAAFAVTMNSYQAALIPLEGGPAGFAAQNGQYLGAFQLSTAALEDAGYKDSSGNWTALAASQGVTSDASFLANQDAQVSADDAYNAANVSYMSNYSSLLGTTDAAGTTLTSGALAYCSESLGAGGCESYLSTGNIPAADLADNPSWQNGGWQSNLAAMSSTSTTGSSDVAVTTTTTTGADGSTTTSTSVSGVFCDPAIANQIAENGVTMVDNWTTLASRPETGYTLLGGQSVLEAAGLITPGQSGYVGSTGLFGSNGGTYGQASCIDRLLNGNLDLVFSPPNLSAILATLLQAACNEATQLFSQVTTPLSDDVFKSFSLDGVVPGMSLSGLDSSIGVSSSTGGSSSGINLSTTSGNYNYTPSTGWYGGSPSTGSANSYGSLFGGAATPSSGGLY
jgi:hypothetical protein